MQSAAGLRNIRPLCRSFMPDFPIARPRIAEATAQRGEPDKDTPESGSAAERIASRIGSKEGGPDHDQAERDRERDRSKERDRGRER